MSHLAERKLIHYSKNKLTDLKNTTIDQEKLLGSLGKPKGLWYAYGEDWKEYIQKSQKPHLSRTMNNTTVRYEFTLPEDTFIKEITKSSPNSILELSKQNLSNFMKRFVKKKYIYPVEDIVEVAINQTPGKGGSSILDEIAIIVNREEEDDEKKVFSEYYEKLTNPLEPEDNDYVDIFQIKEILFDRLPTNYVPSRKALADDHITMFNWTSFWEDVSNTLGGIEFHNDLFDIEQWENIDLPWTNKLDIRSGVIFHPNTFHKGILIKQLELQQMVGGKKRKQHTRRNIKKTKRNRSRHSRR